MFSRVLEDKLRIINAAQAALDRGAERRIIREAVLLAAFGDSTPAPPDGRALYIAEHLPEKVDAVVEAINGLSPMSPAPALRAIIAAEVSEWKTSGDRGDTNVLVDRLTKTFVEKINAQAA